jgi:hypothetical protein
MAQTMQVLEVDDASSITRKGRGKKAERKPPLKSGTERLRRLADRQLLRNSKKLADVLTQQALKGDLASTRVLVGLAERMRQEVDTKHPLRSLALELANAPQWEGPYMDED